MFRSNLAEAKSLASNWAGIFIMKYWTVTMNTSLCPLGVVGGISETIDQHSLKAAGRMGTKVNSLRKTGLRGLRLLLPFGHLDQASRLGADRPKIANLMTEDVPAISALPCLSLFIYL